jgi:uncharacterized cupredoxin-like copper-binding protein
MRSSRTSFAFIFSLVAAAALTASLDAQPNTTARTIAVTAGVPRELSFKVTPARITASPAVFKVLNKGKLPHSFKVCTKPSSTDTANSCAGVATKSLAPGATATLTVKLSASGKYEYLSGIASQAASGMKGLVTVALGSTGSSSSSSSGSGSGSGSTAGSGGATTTTTASSGGGGGGSGGVVNGQATDPACAAGTLIPVGPNTGDEDTDNEGGFPTDGDGCL